MRRVRYHQYGGPEVLQIEDAAEPDPGPGQVRLRTEVVGANFVDTKLRRGGPEDSIFHRPVPNTLTGDVVGTIDAVGEGVSADRIGERAAGLSEDAFADAAVVDEQWLAPVPDGIADADATMLPMAAPIALRLPRLARLEPGETVLIDAAAGGIGHLAVQIAKHVLGAGTVIATAGSAAKLDFVRGLGADVAVDYTEPDWADRVRAAAPGGVDVLLDSIGGEVFRQELGLLAPFGRAVVYGAADGALASVSVGELFALKSVAGYSLLGLRAAAPGLARADITEATGYLASGRVRTALHASFKLSEAPQAHEVLEARANLGRVLVYP
ncbi:MAG TPA: zinc-binding dehydrogenase [Streptosporangiaceae bacterium]|jgi:NADPH2:quinone reductase